MNWSGRVAIVTGGSSGIGRACARALAERGVRIALVARSRDKLDTLAASLGGDNAVSLPLDVTDRAALLALPARAKAEWGRLDFVVNSAGVNRRGPFEGRTPEELAAIVETNLLAPMLLTRAALPLLEADGVVVNIASLAGKIPVPDEAAYSASKAGLRAFARALRTELSLARRRIRIATVCPGPVDTAFFGDDITSVPDLVFSQPMSSAEGVAAKVLLVIEHDREEADIPVLSGKLATLGYLSPRIFDILRPVLHRIGARNKERFVAKRLDGTAREPVR